MWRQVSTIGNAAVSNRRETMAMNTRVGLVLCIFSIATARSLRSSTPANSSSLLQYAYPLGNGRLGALPAGIPHADIINLNIDSLWYGGPFQNQTYNGGNPAGPVYDALPNIRDTIFETGEGNVSELMSDGGSDSYGSYTALANLTVSLEDVENYTDYTRSLDLETAVHTTRFSSNGQVFQQTAFCSNPDDVCVYSINSTSALPAVTVGFQNNYLNTSLFNLSCDQGLVRYKGSLSASGMSFDSIVQTFPGSVPTSCTDQALVLPSDNQNQRITLILSAGTNYDQTKGGPADNYSFKGADPSAYVENSLASASTKTFDGLLAAHVEDHSALFHEFAIELSQASDTSDANTGDIIAAYQVSQGDPSVESLLFDYGRYLLIASSRSNSLPANLQGRWAVEQYPAWSGDYHVDVNLQMNYWPAAQTGLGIDVQSALFNYIRDVWTPYGKVTAERLYNATENGAFVVHSETNPFGYTGMKMGEAYWFDYPAGVAWQVHQVSDYFSYSQDMAWYQSVGFPILKGVAAFWLSQLQPDTYFNDGTLVAAPCNSPEHGPTTFGCAHFQQVIWETFDQVLSTWEASGDTDETFRSSIEDAYNRLDQGVRIGKWGQVQEWKIDQDDQNDTHRHLSHLYGWYPGYSVSGVSPYINNVTVTNAIETTLWSRGNGSGEDANAGWDKVWRSACWAGLNNTERAYFELSFAIGENYAPNGLSMYSGTNLPFQIDANFGLVGAMLAMLVRDLPQAYDTSGTQSVILGPAIPSRWAGGSVRGLKIRGGGSVDFGWDENGVVRTATVSGRSAPVNLFNVNGDVVASL